MDAENTGGSSLSFDDAVNVLRQSRQDQAPTETAPEEPKAEAEEVTTASDDAQEGHAPQERDDLDADDQPEADAEAEAESEAETDPDDDVYQIGDEVFSLAELQEWKNGALRQGDYTKKTQALAKDREVFAKEREAWEVDRQQAHQHIQAMQAQLQEALTTFAIEQPQQPRRDQFPDADSYLRAQDDYNHAMARKQQAQQAHEALQEQVRKEHMRAEVTKALNYHPEWATDEGFKGALDSMTKVVEPYGVSAEEIQQAGLADHRMFRILNRFVELEALVGDQQATRRAAAKKVAKARRPLTPAGKRSESQSEMNRREADARLRKSGRREDAVAALRARRKG